MLEIRQSQIRHFFDCEIKYHLSLKFPLEQTKPMKMGNVFEAIVFDKNKDNLDWDKINKSITKSTRTALESMAEHVKPLFTKGKPFKFIELEQDTFKLRGEADWIGYMDYQGEKFKGIVDLKLTGSITKIWGLGDSGPDFGLKEWDGKYYKHEFLQSFAYPYVYYKKTGNIVPFYYLVVESDTIENMTAKPPLMKLFDCTPKESDLKWFEKVVNTIVSSHENPFVKQNFKHCLDCQFFKSRQCDVGLKEFMKKEKIYLSELEEKNV